MIEISSREVAVRLEAVSWFVTHLAAELEMAGVIDGPRFSQHVREVDWTKFPDAYRQGIGTGIDHLVGLLDQARAARQQR